MYLSTQIEFASKSMDVVVDIHGEYKEETDPNISIEQDDESEKKLINLSTKESEKSKILQKTNTVHHKKNEKSKFNSVKYQNLQEGNNNDIKVVGSRDSVEELGELLINKEDSKIDETVENKSNKNSNQLVEEKLCGRKKWAMPIDQIDKQRPTRKQWSKDTSVIHLPVRSNFWTSEDISAIVENLKQKSFAFDNTAFDSENEEILRIKTSSKGKDMKIEMKQIVDELEFSTFDNQDSSNKETEILKETTITIEDLNEFTNLSDQSFESQNKDEILYKLNRNNISSESRISHGLSNSKKKNFVEKDKKNITDNLSISRSLEKITAQSENYTSEEAVKGSRILIKKRSKRTHNKNYTKNQRHFQENSVSLTEDDFNKEQRQNSASIFEDDDFSRETYNEVKSKRSDMKRGKSKYTECQLQLQQRKDKSSSINVKDDFKKQKQKQKKRKKKMKNDVKYISVTIHRTDILEIDYLTKHPMVKVHIVKAENGRYLKNEDGTNSYLQPMITGKFDFKKNKSILAMWEEEFIFEHDFDELLKIENEQVVILFEIVDLLSFAEASFNYDKFGHEGCWYKVAWAFLKPVGRNNVLHIDKKVRLQLYKPQRNSQKFETLHICEVYTWWKSNIREKYPCSLFVTVTSVDPLKLEPVLCQQLPLYNLSNLRNEPQNTYIRSSDSINLPKWTRLAAQSCKIPNEIFFETDIGENGCFYVTFSNDGKYLAYSLSEEHDYPIVIYEVEMEKIHIRFSGHKTFIYSLNWSNNDNYLLSVSSDQTARIWDVQNGLVHHVEMMPHPSYVYCGKFDPEHFSIVATGCYDRIVRIWIRNKRSKNCDLSQELEGHEGYVNSMCFQNNSNLLTADSIGIVIIWIMKRSRKALSRKEWHISRKIKVREIDGVIINTIVLHPLESRLLVHSRNNGLKMLDLTTGIVLQKYNGLNNQRIQSAACISPCGSLIFCGSEDSSLNVWNLETGNLIAKYTFHRNYRAVTCVDYHPYDHVLAFSTFGSPAPVRILIFNKDATGENIGLKIITEVENTVNNNDISMTFLNRSVKMSKEKLQSSNEKEIIEDASNQKNLQFNKSYGSSLFKSSENVLSVKDKYSDVKMKLQQLNVAGQTLKNRSTNRLYNIIEKIDRILSNTSRSSDDIEIERNLIFSRESNENKVLTSLNENIRRKSGKDKFICSSFEDRSNSYFESSTGSSNKQDAVECYTLQKVKPNDWNTKNTSKNVKKTRSNNVYRNNMSKTFSDSDANCQEVKTNKEIKKSLSQKNIESSFIIETEESDRKSIAYHRSNCSKKEEDSSSSNSTRTYIIEKSYVENNINSSINVFDDLILNGTEHNLNIAKCFESDSSIHSNTTFTIENEVPIIKLRK